LLEKLANFSADDIEIGQIRNILSDGIKVSFLVFLFCCSVSFRFVYCFLTPFVFFLLPLQALTDVREQWVELVIFFQNVTILIKVKKGREGGIFLLMIVW
jgi:hypothetical protein